MKKFEEYVAVADDWEPESEAGSGQEESYVKKAGKEKEASLDEALGLQMISIRLQKTLIDDLKAIANANGIGYQPLIRDVLSRFARSEIQSIMRDALARQELEAKQLQQKMTKPSKRIAKAI